MKKYRYILNSTVFYKTSLDHNILFQSKWIDIFNSHIMIKKGYAWDGCTPSFNIANLAYIGTPEGSLNEQTGLPYTYRASLLHDALYQFKDSIPISRKDADNMFRQVLKIDNFVYSGLYYRVVRALGAVMGKWNTKEFRNVEVIRVLHNNDKCIKMGIKKAIEILETHNKWRRDNENIYKMQNPTQLGIAIDTVVEKFKNKTK